MLFVKLSKIYGVSYLEFLYLCERLNWEPSSSLVSNWAKCPFNRNHVPLRPLLNLIWPIFNQYFLSLPELQKFGLIMISSFKLQIFHWIKRLQCHRYFNISTTLLLPLSVKNTLFLTGNKLSLICFYDWRVLVSLLRVYL